MDNSQLDPLEQQLSTAVRASAPAELRAPVLAAVHRELAAQRWNRRLGRLAAAILVLGIGLNLTVSWYDRGTTAKQNEVASAVDPHAIIEVAVAIGNATDAETGRRMAQQLAALSGMSLTPQQAAAMEQDIRRRVKGGSDRKEGPS